MKQTEEHELSEFDCGDEDLNDFLKTDALKQQEARLNVTKLIMCEDEIIGYVSLLTDTLVLKNINDENLREKIKGDLNINSKNREISAVKIGRLALDKKYIGEGLGTHILRSILLDLKIISKKEIGFRFIIVEGYARAFNFYVVKNCFEYLEKDIEKIKKIDFISNETPLKNCIFIWILKKYEITSQIIYFLEIHPIMEQIFEISFLQPFFFVFLLVDQAYDLKNLQLLYHAIREYSQ